MLAPLMNARLLAIAILGLATACAKSAPRATAAPASDAAAAPESIEELEAELGRYEGELRTLAPGKAKDDAKTEPTQAGPADGGGATAAADADDEQRPRVCERAEAICGLEDRICGLASEHDDDARYAAACERASRDCATATEACDAQT